MSLYVWLPLLTIVIGGGSYACYLLFVRPVTIDPRAKVSEAWLADHNGGPYTGGK